MATISENLQTIKNSVSAIKQAISDKGGDVSGDISTWADAISGLSGGGSSSGDSSEGDITCKCVIMADPAVSQDIIENNIFIYNFLINKYGACGSESNPKNISNDTPRIFCSGFSSISGQCVYIYIPTGLSYVHLYDANGMMSYYCVHLTNEGYATNYFWD